MPQNSYSNADLGRFKRTPSRPEDMEVLSETMREPSESPFANEPSVESLLSAARGTLGRSQKLADETGSADIAQIPRRMNNLRGHAMPDLDPIDMLDAAATVPMAASVLPTPAAPVTAAMAGLMKTPKALRSLLQGNYGEGAMEGVEAALVGAPGPIGRAIGSGFSKAKSAVGGAVNRFRQGGLPSTVRGGTAATEIPYAGQQVAQNPNQVLDVARDVAFENGDDLARTLKPQGPESAAALLRLTGSGAEARGAAAVRGGQAAASRSALFERAGVPEVPGVDPTDFMGDRTTGYTGELPQLFADDLAGKNVYPLPNSSRYMSEVDSLTAGLSDEPFELMDDALDVSGQVQPNARDVDMLMSGVLPEQEAAQASAYASDTAKRKVGSRGPRSAGSSAAAAKYAADKGKRKVGQKSNTRASLRALQDALLPMADDVVNAGYRSAKE